MGAALRVGNDVVCSRPYAGNSEYPTVLARVIHPFLGWTRGSENPFGADNQQERLGGMVGKCQLDR
jgi:hypothetical protein